MNRAMTGQGHQGLNRWFLLVCFFLSGACGLIYEVAWLRVLGLVFGNTTFATSTVLAGYMAGLGLGAVFFGRIADRHPNPVRLYAWLEGGVAGYAFLTPWIWKGIELVYVSFYRAAEPSFAVFSLFRFAVAFTALFIPTFFMGGTLPVLCRYFARGVPSDARPVGLLYALNTFGAVAGVLLSGFFLLQWIGVWQTVFLAGGMNLIVFLFFFRVSSASGYLSPAAEMSAPGAQDAAGRVPLPRPLGIFMLTLFGVSGAVSMMYEVSWTRVLALVLGSSVYAFSVMLATFLLGIAAGSYFFSIAARRFRIDLFAFASLQVITSISALMGLGQFEALPYYFLKVYEWTGGASVPMEFGKFVLCLWVMLAPTLCIGAMFACFIHVYRRSEKLGGEVGTAYGANTVGTILGSILTGFVLIPWLGIQHTLIAAGLINAGIGISSFVIDRNNFRGARLVFMSCALGLAALTAVNARNWDHEIMTSGIAVHPERLKGISKDSFRQALKEKEVLFYREGLSSTVAVSRLRDNLQMSVNGKVDASTKDSFTQFLLGHLPMALHPDPQEVLVIGLGSGSTLAAVASYPAKVLDGVELEPAVVEAAKFFNGLNRNVLKDKRVRIFVNDGRNVLLLRPERYDVIISEPSNPWMAGVANLFSLEHYKTMRARLNPRGLVCQWLHAYSMSPEDLRMIVATFLSVFNEASLWTSYYPDLMLIGSNEPMTIDYRRLEEAFRTSAIEKDLCPHGNCNPSSFLSNFWLDTPSLRELAQGAKINSDNHPFLEFSAPKNLYRDTLKNNFELLESRRVHLKLPRISRVEPALEKNSDFYLDLAEGYLPKLQYGPAQRALAAAAKIDPNSPRFHAILGRSAFMTGDDDVAFRSLSAALQLQPDSPQANYYMGLVLARMQRFEQAQGFLVRAVMLEDDNEKYLDALAQHLALNRDVSGALKVFGRLAALQKTDYDATSNLLNAVFKEGTVEQRLALSKVALELYPHSPAIYERCGQALVAAGRYDEAVLLWERLIRDFSEQPLYYLEMAEAYVRMGKKEEARRSLEKAFRLKPELKNEPDIKKIWDTLDARGAVGTA